MNIATKKNPNRRPKLEPTAVVLLDQARARILARQRTTLSEVRQRLEGLLEDEISGVVVARR
ncbi:hypothetical protein OU995_21355 [Roseateles sp. SL47]|uniref:hypothetical protein n=1 Tax=Roseateles sp. SL47 TaxID=2995138 RepID=UPI00226E2F37|nr:hypothetical protein [Roseateles sp. SL47]WAC72091.1 hypothetical protein OU995_21355 [Roseateles sp. SL47]